VKFHVTLKDQCLRVCKNRVLRRIFGHKGTEVTGGWRELHNEGLNNLYSSRNIIRVIEINGDETGDEECSTHGRDEKILLGKPEGENPTRAFICRWKQNIETGLKAIGCDVEWIHVAQDGGQLKALVNTVMNLPVP
jgi:hypothetical protein